MFEINFEDNKNFEKCVDKIIRNIEYNDSIIYSILTFEKQLNMNISHKNKYRFYFYRTLLEKILDNIDIILLERVSNLILETLQKSYNDYNKYLIMMDTYILLGIRLYYESQIENAVKYFKKAIVYGEENKKYSKKNFYDALNCSYSWLGVIFYNENNFNKAYKCFNAAIEHYEEVKNKPNYFVKEQEIIEICKKYISAIKELNI